MPVALTNDSSLPPRPKPRRPLLILAGAALVVLLLLPIWIVHFPPLLDYPNHLASGFVLGHLHDSRFDFSQYYGAQWGLKPYVAVDFLTTSFAKILPAQIAGKLVLSLGVLALPLSVWFFLRQANPHQEALAAWALIAAYNIFFFYGFMGYFCSISLLFFSVTLWLRFLDRQTAARWLLACAAITVTYFFHVFGWLFLGLIVCVYSLTRPRIREWLLSAALFLPTGFLYFIFSRAAQQQSGAEFRTASDKLESFWTIIHGYSSLLDWISLAAFAAVFVVGVIRNGEARWNWRWILVSLAMLIAYIALPLGYGDGWNIDIRALPVLFVLLLAVATFGKRARWFVPIALLLFVVRTVNIIEHFRAAQPELQAMAQAFSMTPMNARVLPIVEGNDEDPIAQPYPHFWAYGVIRRGWFSPYLFTLPGLLPLQVKADVYDPDGFWNLSYESAPDWAQVRADFDYVWAYDVGKFEAGLDTIGDLVYANGKLDLYRIRKPPAPPQPASGNP